MRTARGTWCKRSRTVSIVTEQFRAARHGDLPIKGVTGPGWGVFSVHSGQWVQPGMDEESAKLLAKRLNEVITRRRESK